MWITTIWTRPISSWSLLDLLGVGVTLVIGGVVAWIAFFAAVGLWVAIQDGWKNSSPKTKAFWAFLLILLIGLITARS